MLLPVLVLSLVAGAYFSIKTYKTFSVLQHARALDIPDAGNIRAWMTIDYIAKAYGTSSERLLEELALPSETDRGETLRTLSEQAGMEPLAYVQRAQDALARLDAAQPPEPAAAEDAGWLAQATDAIFSALLLYGYPVLFTVLFLGALGLPVPAGPLATVAGSLAMQGELNWALVCALSVAASVSGDLTGYAAGRVMTPGFLDRWGRWIGYTKANRQRLDALYARWGGLTLILTRSLVAYIGAIASILAGAGRYRLDRFVALSVIGRLLWTAPYFGLGYTVGSDLEIASGFLGYLSLLLIAGAVAIGSATLHLRLRRAPPSA